MYMYMENREKDIEMINKLDEQRREIAKKDFEILFKEFDRLSRKTKDYLDNASSNLQNDLKSEAQNILSQSLEALKLGFAQIDTNSEKRYSEALVKLGVMEKHKKD